MTESEPDWPGLGTQAGPDPLARTDPTTRTDPLAGCHPPPGTDPLAARLLAARRALTARDIDPEVRTRLHLRLMAICTSLKMPAANRARGAERLDRLIADAQLARRGTCAASARPAGLGDPAGVAGLGDPAGVTGRTDPGERTGR